MCAAFIPLSHTSSSFSASSSLSYDRLGAPQSQAWSWSLEWDRPGWQGEYFGGIVLTEEKLLSPDPNHPLQLHQLQRGLAWLWSV